MLSTTSFSQPQSWAHQTPATSQFSKAMWLTTADGFAMPGYQTKTLFCIHCCSLGINRDAPACFLSNSTVWEPRAVTALLLCHLSPDVRSLVLAVGKLPHCIHSLMQHPAWPRGTEFAEQAAIQFFVFSSLFSVWPQAKPCSEYRTGGFLTGFTTVSPRAAHKCVYCYASSLSKREAKKWGNESCRFSFPPVPLRRSPRAWFSELLCNFKALLPPDAPCGCTSSALLQLSSQVHTLERKHEMKNTLFDGLP